MIDRITPTLRPAGRAVGFQQWRSLLFMHWPIPPEVLRPLVPAVLELDLHEGTAYVGLVPFAMRQVRPRWAPARLGFDFLETNVRTYVTSGDRPGVYFFSLDAASRIGVWIARTLWSLPYHYAQMHLEEARGEIAYRSVRRGTGARHVLRCRIGANLGPSQPGSLEFFLLERYLLFVERRGTLLTGQVHHTPYPVQQTEVLALEDELLAAAGCGCCRGLPPVAHYSAGVEVEIFPLHRGARQGVVEKH